MNARVGIVLAMLLMFMQLASSSNLPAADVETGVSTRETYVGLPIILQIYIHNAVEHEAPELPEIDGLVIESTGPPSRSSRILDINGRRTQRLTVTYSFRVTPTREGSFTIPPVKIVADGRYTITKAVRIVASKSETNDLVFVEIAGKDSEIYVGEALDLTLKIWIRPYRDKEYQVALDESDMWSLITSQSNWGAFAESLEAMAENRQRPGGKEVLRKDSSGDERGYLLYEIDATVYPDRPGQIDGDEVRIVLNYPLELGRSRSPFSLLDDDDFFGGSLFDDSFFRGFGSSLAVTKSRPIVAEATVEPILVKPIPQQGRPADYRGAVGKYSIITEAKPTSVKAGDPITLHIGIDGSGRMDVVRAPPLETQQDLTRDFKVPDEPLAGFVAPSNVDSESQKETARKVFTTTIRPRNDKVNQIPPISFSYFDPDAEKFVTVTSDPIPIQVEPADVLALDAIVGGKPAANNRIDRETAEFAGPRSAPRASTPPPLFADIRVLRSMPRARILSSQLVTLVIVPPLLTLAVFLFVSRHAFSSLVSARRRFRHSLAKAESRSEVAEALEQYLAKRFRLDDSRLARDQTVGCLRALGHHELAVRTQRLYSTCEKQAYAAKMDSEIESLKSEATNIAEGLSARALVSHRSRRLRPLSTTSTVILAVLASFPSTLAADGPPTLDLSVEQQRTLLREAIATFESAQNSDEAYAKSADKFQLLVDSGIENDRLYFNLATAQLRASRHAPAIANYRRALRIDPSSQLYRDHLARAEAKVARSADTSLRIGDSLRTANDIALRVVQPRVVQGIFVAAWGAFWCILVLRTVGVRFYWKSAAVVTFCCAALAAASYFFRVTEFARDDVAVLTSGEVTVHQGDGEEFPEITKLAGAEGRVVKVLDRRGDWLQVGLESGTVGWVRATDSEQI